MTKDIYDRNIQSVSPKKEVAISNGWKRIGMIDKIALGRGQQQKAESSRVNQTNHMKLAVVFGILEENLELKEQVPLHQSCCADYSCHIPIQLHLFQPMDDTSPLFTLFNLFQYRSLISISPQMFLLDSHQLHRFLSLVFEDHQKPG